ncbi:polyprotein of viral origin, putative, partial [Ixodes scapularis]
HLVKNRIVVPESFKNYVTQLYHDTPYSGHRGTGKTSKRLREKYFWHGMQKKVQNYCAQCVSCIRPNASHNRRRAPLQVFKEVAHPFQRAGMNSVGPFPTTTEGNRYLLVF